MTKQHKYLKLRGKTYAIRVPVLKELQAIIGKTEITRSLKTRDLNQANIRYPEYLAAILKQFEIARAKLDDEKPAHLIGFDPFGTVHDWFRQRYGEITNQTKSEFENETLIAEFKHGLKTDLAELMSVNPDRKFHMVSNLANFLLLAKGYPTSKGSGLANVDTHDPKFVLFLELLVTAQVELIEYNLSRLGEHITKTPNGRIFWQEVKVTGETKVSGTSIVKLIDEFMDVKGSVGKAKTISDKVAAFRYLRELVGDTFLVENLNRDHFLEVRKILSAYPINARKLKVLKNKTLQEKSAYAVKHKLALMSKQNANKIIRRLKSLMVYAVATGVIMKNPCTLIDFHISEAERAESAREKFSDEQLIKLFKSEAFDLDYPLGSAMYWVPLIALFHGFRMEEILLLTLEEINRDSITGIRYFNLTEFTTDDLKNANALRRVPFHPILKKLGFEKYLASCKNNKGLRLFPELKRATGMDPTYRKLFSPKYSRYLKKVGVHTKKTVFHSFRHNFSAVCTDGEVPLDYENALAGWSLKGGQNGNYKKPKDISLKKLNKMMKRVDYPALDLTHLYVK